MFLRSTMNEVLVDKSYDKGQRSKSGYHDIRKTKIQIICTIKYNKTKHTQKKPN